MNTHPHRDADPAHRAIRSLGEVMPPEATPAFEAARAIGLARALGAARARRRKRFLTRAGSGLGALALAALVGNMLLGWPAGLPSPAPGGSGLASGPTTPTNATPDDASEPARTAVHPEITGPPAPPGVRTVRVANDPGVVERLRAAEAPTRVFWLSDEEVLADLRALGMPAGIVRTGERTRVAFHRAKTPLFGPLGPPEP
jgi:hypothetical protein